MTKKAGIYNGKMIVSSKTVIGKLDSYKQKNETRPLSWIKGLIVRPETLKLLEENIGSVLFDTGLRNTFLDLSISKDNKSKNKQNLIKKTNKKLCIVKVTINKMKRQSPEYKKIFSNHIFNMGLISNI